MGIATAVTIGTALYGAYSSNQMRQQAESQAKEALAAREKQQAKVDEEMSKYRAMKFTNPYADMENAFEDLKVSTAAAEFRAEQGDQQRADILSQLRGAAGPSGVAGLAQMLANQGQLQTKAISANLQKQEVMNERLRATGAQKVAQLQASGDAMVQQAESGRQASILGAQYGQAAGANMEYQRSLLNQQYADQAADQMMISSLGSLASGIGDINFSKLGQGFGSGLGSNLGSSLNTPMSGPRINFAGETVFSDLSNLKI